MNVTIRFFIDEETLTMAVRHCLHFQMRKLLQWLYAIACTSR